MVYEDAQGVKAALEKLQKLPPLVTTQEVRRSLSFDLDLAIDDGVDQQSEAKLEGCRPGKGFRLARRYVSTPNQLRRRLIQTSIGDCAELFDYCNQDMIEAKVKLLLQMSLVLIWGKSIALSAISID